MWRKFSSLVVGEVGGTGRLATATMHAVTAAREFPGPIHVHVLGPKSAAEDAAAIDGVDEVIWQDAPNRLTAEVIAPHI
jgi:electron transfer flavoprotein alpha subunit